MRVPKAQRLQDSFNLNICKRIMKAMVVLIVFLLAIVMVWNSLQESFQNPVLTSLQLAAVMKAPFPAISIDTGDTMQGENYLQKAIQQIEFECLTKGEDSMISLQYICSPDQLSGGIRGLFNETMQVLMLQLLSKMTKRLETNPKELQQSYFHFKRKWGKLNYETISDELVIGIQQGHINQSQLMTTMSNLCATYFGFQDILDLVYKQEIIQKRALTSFVHHDFDSVNVTKNTSLKHIVEAILIAPFRTFMSRAAEDDISLEFVLLIMALIESKPTSKDRLESQLIWNLFNESLSGRLLDSLVESVDLKEDGPYLQAEGLYRYFGCHSGAEIIYQTLWEEHVYSKSRNQSSPPCDDANHSLLISNCCKVLTFLNQNIRPVLQVIKYSIQSPTMMQSLEEHESDFGHTSLFPNYPQIRAPNAKEKLKIKELLKYGRPPSFSPQISMMRNPRSRVFVCYFGDKKGFPSPFECEGFYRKIGNQGLTFTYNGGKFWDHYQVTPTSTLFYEGLLSDNKNQKGQAQRYPGTKDRGSTFSMILRLDPDLELVQHRHLQLASSFKLNLHDPLDVPDFQSSFIEIKPMYEYTIKVVPFLTAVSKDFEKLDQSYRECRLLTETKGLHFFKHYTQTGCIYECQINYARAKCGCTPWNVPNLHSNWRLCDFYGNSCFQYVLSSLDTSECDCPVNCNLGRYEYSVTALNMQPERLCRDNYDFDLFNSLVDPIYIGTKQFAQTARQLLRNESESKLEQCLRKVKRLALVRVQLGSQTVTVAQKDVRVTIGLMLSNLGGTVSLFTGISILSLVQGFYFVYAKARNELLPYLKSCWS